MDTFREFWMVWCDRGSAPTVKHDTRESAQREAERLAAVHPGHRFWVLRAESVCRVNNVSWTQAHQSGCGCPDCIPF